MLVECSHCGAPLDTKHGKAIAKCGYCGQKNQLQAMRQLAPQTPPGWRPPPVWTPPQHLPAATRGQLKYHKGSSSLGCVFLLPVLIGVLAPGLAIFMSQGGAGWLKAAFWDGKSTIKCGLNEELELEDIEGNVSGGPVVDMATNCKLKIKNSKLKGRIGIQAGINAKITLEKVTIEAEDAAIAASTNLELRVGPKSKLTGGDVAIRAGNNADVILRGTQVEGEQAAVEASGNLELTAEAASKLKGNVIGVMGRSNPTIELRDSAIQATSIAVEASNNLKLRLKGKSWIDGGKTAVRAEHNPEITLQGGKIQSRGTAIEASHNAKINCTGGAITGGKSFSLTMNPKLRLSSCKVTGPRNLGSNAKVEED